MGDEDDFLRGTTSRAGRTGTTDRVRGLQTSEAPESDDWVQVEQAHFDPGGERELGTAIVYAVANAKHVGPNDYAALPPLNECVDSEALEKAVFQRADWTADPATDAAISFVYADYRVTVRSDGWILVAELR